MDRRGFLSGVAATTAFGLASGCLGGRGAGGDGPGAGDDTASPTASPTDIPAGVGTESPTGEPTDSPTGTSAPPETDAPTGTPGAGPRLSGRTFRRTGDCTAAEADSANVSFGADAVTVTGCITGNDGCQQAALESADYDDGADTLTVVVTTNAGGDTPDVCTQQLVHRAYEAVLTFDGGLPAEVGVVHDSGGDRSEVARASRE